MTIAMFEGTIRVIAVAAALMTIVASQGGNAGVQTMTLVVRGLAIGALEPGALTRLIRRELAIGALNGLMLGTTCGLLVYAWRGDARLSLVLAGAMFANLLVAATLGSVVPIALRVLRVDPAVASSVFVHAGTDVLGMSTTAVRDGDHWGMFYFGVGRGGAHIMAAFSRDLYHWTSHPEPLYKAGGHPEGLDKKYAHKISLVYTEANDTFYLFYCAVGRQGRGIGLITSKPFP